jgi:hypothetical protein
MFGASQQIPWMQESGPAGQQAPPSPQLLAWQNAPPFDVSGAQQDVAAEPEHCDWLAQVATHPPPSNGQA